MTLESNSSNADVLSQEANLLDLRRRSLQVVLIGTGVANFMMFHYSVFARLVMPEAATTLFTATVVWGVINWICYKLYQKDKIDMASRVLIAGMIITTNFLLLMPDSEYNFYAYIYLIIVAISGLLITPLASFAVAFIGPVSGFITTWSILGAKNLTLLFAPTVLSVLMAGITWAGANNLLTSYRWAIESRQRASKRRDELFNSQQKLKKTNDLLETTNVRLAQSQAQLRKAQEELELLVADLRRLNLNKDKFFSIVAHDLKGPFMPLLGTSELLVEMADFLQPSEVKELGSSLNRSANNVYSLLENLLQWARMQMGRIEYEPIRFNIADVIQQNISLLSENATKKGIVLQSRFNASPFVNADQNMIDTVIRNLISNSLKFTPKDGAITLSTTKVEDEGIPFLQVSVADTGVGIPPEDLEKLFKIEVHHTTLGTNNEKGTGLGLVMCQEMVHKNGGNIWVESTLQEGTTFFFTIPFDTSVPESDQFSENGMEQQPWSETMANGNSKNQEFTAPSVEEMTILLDLARMGDLETIKTRVNDLKESNTVYVPFSQRIHTLAQDFDEEEILRVIEKHMPQLELSS